MVNILSFQIIDIFFMNFATIILFLPPTLPHTHDPRPLPITHHPRHLATLDKNTFGVRSCHMFMSTLSLNYFTFAPLEESGVFLVGLFLHENQVTSQGHAAYCDSLAGISVFSWLLEDNKRENDSSKRVRRDYNVFLSGDGCLVNRFNLLFFYNTQQM